MPQITSQSLFRSVKKPKFCYLCGLELSIGEEQDRDHCPPENIFNAVDRIDYPLILRVHKKCNSKWTIADEQIGIIFSAIHGDKRTFEPKFRNKIKTVEANIDGKMVSGLVDFPLVPMMNRIIKLSHAILYGEYLNNETPNFYHIPFPQTSNGGNQFEPVLPQTIAFSKKLILAQHAGTFDSIVAWNKKFKYVSTWSNLDNGKPICIFSFDIYQLSNLAFKLPNFPRAVIGYYERDTIPRAATKCTSLIIPIESNPIDYPICI